MNAYNEHHLLDIRLDDVTRIQKLPIILKKVALRITRWYQ